MSFKNSTAIITGGTGTLGSIVAQDFIERGARIAVPYTSEKSLASIPPILVAEKDRALFAKADLTSEKDVQAFTDQTVQKFGSVEILVNTTGGYTGGKPVRDVTLEEWEKMMNLNLKTTFLMCRSVVPIMQKNNYGRIINISAMAAIMPRANIGPYAVSKRALITLTEAIAEETKGTGITVNAIAPSIIVTEANKHAMPNADYDTWVTAEEISHLIIYLCSQEARSVSGNVIKIFGGV